MTLVRANAIALPLRDKSVNLIVTSPPYFSLRAYQDGGEAYDGQIGSEPTPQDFLEALWGVTEECARVLADDGSLFVNLGDKYSGSGGHNNAELARARDGGGKQNPELLEGFLRDAPKGYNKNATVRSTTGPSDVEIKAKSLMGLPWRYALGCIDKLGLILRAEIIWSKPNPMPESVRDRVARSHEQWFHFVKQGTYFANIDPIREAFADGTAERYAHGYGDRSKYNDARIGTAVDLGGNWDMNANGKLPRSVWEITTEGVPRVPAHLTQHFAAFPSEWPRKLIQAWCPPDGRVLDPFGGTGTTAMVARSLGRSAVHVDLSLDYLRLAQWRIFESGQGNKALSRANEEAQRSFV